VGDAITAAADPTGVTFTASLARLPPASSAPTLDRWALLLLGMLAAGMAWMVLRKPLASRN
jgi:hypothetical protein